MKSLFCMFCEHSLDRSIVNSKGWIIKNKDGVKGKVFGICPKCQKEYGIHIADLLDPSTQNKREHLIPYLEAGVDVMLGTTRQLLDRVDKLEKKLDQAMISSKQAVAWLGGADDDNYVRIGILEEKVEALGQRPPTIVAIDSAEQEPKQAPKDTRVKLVAEFVPYSPPKPSVGIVVKCGYCHHSYIVDEFPHKLGECRCGGNAWMVIGSVGVNREGK